MENSGNFLKIKNSPTIWSSNPTSGYIFERTRSRISKRYSHTHVYSIVYNSQAVEVFQLSISLDGQKICYICVLYVLHMLYTNVCVSHSVMSDSLWSHSLYPTRLPYPWDSPGKNTEMGCHALLQGIFLTQGSNCIT